MMYNAANSEHSLKEDKQLIAMLQNAETREDGFRQLLERYQEKLYWHIRRMVGSHDDANDVMQNSLMKVYRGIHKFRGDSSIYTWMFQIARNETFTYLKKNQRVTVVLDHDQMISLTEGLKADPYFDGDEIQMELELAIRSLPPKQREVFLMRYYGEHSYHELAEMLNRSVGGLKANFHHALKKIEEHLRESDLLT